MSSSTINTAALLRQAIPDFGEARARSEAEFMESKHIALYTRAGATLPAALLDCDPVPETLFVCGDCDLGAVHSIAIVGTRKPTGAGLEFCRQFISDIGRALPDTLIVSGLAYGIDVAAHRAALDEGLPTAAVLAHGLDTLYPAMHRDTAARIIRSGRGALVTEYTTGTRIHRNSFLARNRIIAGLAKATIVVESADHGGSLYTARLARSYGRPVFAVPGRWSDSQSAGTNRLISSGQASLLTSAKDFIEMMNWGSPSLRFDFDTHTPQAPELEGDAKVIADYLRMYPDTSRDDLTEALNMTSAQLSARVMEMELDGLLTVLPGNRLQLNF